MKQSIKTRMTVILAIIIYIILMKTTVDGITPYGLYDTLQLTRDESGKIYLVCASDDEVMVGRMDMEGYADRFYRCGRKTQDAQLLCAYYEGKLYISQVWQETDDIRQGEDTGQHFSVWQTEVRGFRCILQGTIDSETAFTDMRVDRSGIHLSGVDLQTQEAVTYRYQDEELLVRKYVTDFVPRTVYFSENGLYMLSNDNRMYFVGAEENSRNPVGQDLGEAAVIFAD